MAVKKEEASVSTEKETELESVISVKDNKTKKAFKVSKAYYELNKESLIIA